LSLRESLEVLEDLARGRRGAPLAVVEADDEDVLLAVDSVRREGLISPILLGRRERVERALRLLGLEAGDFELVECEGPEESSRRAVSMVRSGEASFLMKGSVSTSTLLKAVLDREAGLRSGRLLSHVFFIEVPRLSRVFCLTDGGLNVRPDLQAKVGILENAVWCYHRLGIAEPRVAVLSAVEVVNPDIPSTLDAAALVQMNRRGQIKGCLVDGPLALDNALSLEACRHKGIDSPVGGEADVLLVPHIEAGNLLGKALFYTADAFGAGAVVGALAPVVLTSRASDARTKRLSILLGSALGARV